MLDWQRVGLSAPTTDPVAIKRAYAIKLRQTRPDDDAAAYQALREAYDRLLRRTNVRPPNTVPSFSPPLPAVRNQGEVAPANRDPASNVSVDSSAPEKPKRMRDRSPPQIAEPLAEPAPRRRVRVMMPRDSSADRAEAAPDFASTAPKGIKRNEVELDGSDSASSPHTPSVLPEPRKPVFYTSPPMMEPAPEPVQRRKARVMTLREVESREPQPAFVPGSPTAPPDKVERAFGGSLPAVDAVPEPPPERTSRALTPRDLAAHLAKSIETDGHEAVMTSLISLREHLDALPLHWRTDATVRFADLVIATPALSSAALEWLDVYFDWRGDYRSARVLGMPRWEALCAALQAIPRPSDIRASSAFTDALMVVQVQRKGRGWRAMLVAALLSPIVRFQMASALPGQLRAMGLDTSDQAELTKLCGDADRLVVLWLGLSLVGAGLMVDEPIVLALGRTAATLVIALFALVFLSTALGFADRLRHALLPLAGKLRVERWRAAWPWVGIGLLCAASVGFNERTTTEGVTLMLKVASSLSAAAGLFLALPLRRDQALVSLVLWFFAAAFGPSTLTPTVWVALAAWALAGLQLFLQGGSQAAVNLLSLQTYVPKSLIARLARPFLIVPALLLLVSFSIPLIAANVTVMAGARVTLTAVGVATMMSLGVAAESQRPLAWSSLFMSLLVLLILQRGAYIAGRRLGQRWSR